jgi:hypothetical protein
MYRGLETAINRAVSHQPALPGAKVYVEFTVGMTLPEQDLDLIEGDVLLNGLRNHLIPLAHYRPTVERRTKDWEIEASKRGNRRPRPGIYKERI